MRTRLLRYARAPISIAVAVLIRKPLMGPLLGMRAPYAVFYAAVVWTAFAGERDRRC
jgi:hypothetical protein